MMNAQVAIQWARDVINNEERQKEGLQSREHHASQPADVPSPSPYQASSPAPLRLLHDNHHQQRRLHGRFRSPPPRPLRRLSGDEMGTVRVVAGMNGAGGGTSSRMMVRLRDGGVGAAMDGGCVVIVGYGENGGGSLAHHHHYQTKQTTIDFSDGVSLQHVVDVSFLLVTARYPKIGNGRPLLLRSRGNGGQRCIWLLRPLFLRSLGG
jgi:hypothetical protein